MLLTLSSKQTSKGYHGGILWQSKGGTMKNGKAGTEWAIWYLSPVLSLSCVVCLVALCWKVGSHVFGLELIPHTLKGQFTKQLHHFSLRYIGMCLLIWNSVKTMPTACPNKRNSLFVNSPSFLHLPLYAYVSLVLDMT